MRDSRISCTRCQQKFRHAFTDPVYGACCPVCFAPLTRGDRKKFRRATRKLDIPVQNKSAREIEFDRADPGSPLGVGMPSGSGFREDGDSHREGWMRVIRRDPCSYCGRLPNSVAGPMSGKPKKGEVRGTVDHIEPQSRKPRGIGGVHSWINYTSACESCNGKKGSMPLLEYLGRRAGAVFPARSWEARQQTDLAA